MLRVGQVVERQQWRQNEDMVGRGVAEKRSERLFLGGEIVARVSSSTT